MNQVEKLPPDIEVWYLLKYSNDYLQQAHSLNTKMRHLPTGKQLDTYNSLIKASLNCLFKLASDYLFVLDANIQAIIYYKISTILFNETLSYDLALDYCSKGIQICKRNENILELTITKLKLNYLNFQILNNNISTTSHTSLLSLLNNIIQDEIPTDDSFTCIKLFFQFIKFQNFNVLYLFEKNFNDLNSIHLQLDNIIEKSTLSSTPSLSELTYFNQLILVNILSQQLLNNEPLETLLKTLTKIQSLQDSHFNKSSTLSLQFKAMIILFEIIINIKHYKSNKVNEIAQNLLKFIKNIKLNNSNPKNNKLLWTSSKISFNFTVKHNLTFPFELNWLTFKEFNMISYFYLSICYSYKSWDNKNKSDKLFTLTNNLLNDVSVSSSSNSSTIFSSETQIIRTNYTKIFLSIYQLFSDIIKDDYPTIEQLLKNERYKEINKFMESYNTGKYSNYEIIIYNNIIPLLYLIFAMIYQRNGEHYKSLKYYIQIRTNFLNNTIDDTKTFQQFTIQNKIGLVNPFNKNFHSLINNQQLYLITTLNTIPLLSHIIELEKLKNNELSEFDVSYDKSMKRFKSLLKLKDSLFQDLSKLEENIPNIGTFNDDQLNELLVKSTISTINFFYTSSKSSTAIINNLSIDKISQITPFLTSLIYLIKGYSYKYDAGLKELNNLNKKVGYFTSACKYAFLANNSIKANNNPLINYIAKLGYLEIWKIMNNNKNLYDIDKINHVRNKFVNLTNGIELKDESTPEPVKNENVKRVKFN
ncbi:hypothetical protein DAPK24_053390 [Pichia kluyveri]|uniref:Uncharacterized protein n=1 Tax=Pichia kluyveri TaxID=36015 RepID=A0AAV5RBW9_PICKL|nr:hypothetical protein DAPK24_053390 [Pichia kluyveri]